MRWLILALTVCSSLLAGPLQVRAKHAEVLLGELQLDEAFEEYTSILREIPELTCSEKSDLEFAYWIYRERGYTAFLMDDLRTMQCDIEKMKQILVLLGFSPDYGMDEYYYAIELAQKAKDFLKSYSPPSGFSLSIGSWFQKRWDDIKLGSERFRSFVDESYCRVIHNEDRLEQIHAQKRAQELYYPNIKHSREEMDHLARFIHEKDLELWHDVKNFAYERGLDICVDAILLASTIKAAKDGNAGVSWASLMGVGGQTIKLMNELQKGGGPLWNKYETVQNDRGRLTRMNLENREASYVKCILEKKTPKLYYAPEKDTPWYNGYYFLDLNNDRFEFTYGFSKQF